MADLGIENIISKLTAEEFQKFLKSADNEILTIRQRLVIINDQIKKYLLNNKNQEIKKNNQSIWRDFLSEGYQINWDALSKKEEQDLSNLITEGYILTTQILSKLEVIDKVSTTVTVIYKGKGGYSYTRLNNTKITTERTRLSSKSKKRGGGMSLRIQAAQLKQQIEKAKQEQIHSQLQQHFRDFIAPFVEWSEQSSNHWKPNVGIMGEAFENHLEINHNMEEELNQGILKNCDLGSVGSRWQLYLKSSGSAPYFTGPDTLYAQVKNINASIISNLSTVIETINAVLNLLDEQTGQLKKSKEEIKKLLEQDTAIKSINLYTLEGIRATAPNEIAEILTDLISKAGDGLTVSYKQGENKKTQKIHSYEEYQQIRIKLLAEVTTCFF